MYTVHSSLHLTFEFEIGGGVLNSTRSSIPTKPLFHWLNWEGAGRDGGMGGAENGRVWAALGSFVKC